MKTLSKLLLLASFFIALNANAQLLKKDIQKGRVVKNELNNFNPKGDEIWFFEHENYQGKKLVLKAGTYTLNQMGVEWNDKISSILIPEGYEIQIFENDNFMGNNANLDGYWQEGTTMQRWSNKDYNQLKVVKGDDYKTNYNDLISSIQIYNQKNK
jgi:hypothetical protein